MPNINPTGGWSQSGELLISNPNQNVTLQADFVTKGLGAADYYTIQFGIGPRPINPGTGLFAPIAPEAVINWNNQGNSVRRRITVGNGTTISGTAQGANVRLYDRLPTSLAVIQTTYPATILISPGARPGLYPPVLVGNQDGYPAAGGLGAGLPLVVIGIDTLQQQIFEVPDDAGVTSTLVSVSPASSTNYNILGGDTQVLHIDTAGIIYQQYDPVVTRGLFVPLAPVANRVVLQNNSAVELEFTLLFGVEG